MKTSLLGDLYHTQKNAEQFKNQDMEALFNDTLPMFQGNDICFVNLECAITESEKRRS